MVLTLLIIGIAFNLFIGFLVSLKRGDKSARALALVALAMIVWQLANYFADRQGSYTLLWNRMSFALPVLVIALSNYFILALRNGRASKVMKALVASGTIVIIALCFSPFIVEAVTPRMHNGAIQGFNPVYGPMYFQYIAWLVVLALTYITQLRHHKTNKNTQNYEQILLIRQGSILAVLIAVTTNIIIPNLMKSSSSTQFVPLTSIALMSAFAIAILRHKLFDIRAFVLRAAAYSVTVSILALCYIAPVIFVFLKIFNLPFNLFQFSLAVLIGTIAASYYFRLQQRFNMLTRNIFFRESYDPAEFLNELNKSLVKASNLIKLLDNTKQLIEKYLKSDSCSYVLPFLANDSSSLEDADKLTYKGQIKAAEIHEFMSIVNEDVIFLNEIIPLNKRLYDLLQSEDVAIIVRLMPSKNTQDQSNNGYMIVSQRKSGRPYDLQDKQIFEAMTNTLDIAMQNALRFEEIQSFNRTLSQRVEEATHKLRITNEKLRKMDETKDEFISMASHQLRTPLTSVKGYVSMVLDGDVGPITAPQRELLQQSFVSSQRMANLISDMLNLSRINTGKFVIEPSEVHLPTVLEAELGQLREIATNKNITLKMDIPTQFPTLMLDEGKMHQVMMNLIDNALYYTPENGTVTVQLNDTPSAIEFKVIDTGIGVPRDAQKHLFTKMYRAENARRTRPDGTGLGLFMVKKVVIAQGGSIIFESEEGKGSTFGFRFSKKNHVSSAPLNVRPVETIE